MVTSWFPRIQNIMASLCMILGGLVLRILTLSTLLQALSWRLSRSIGNFAALLRRLLHTYRLYYLAQFLLPIILLKFIQNDGHIEVSSTNSVIAPQELSIATCPEFVIRLSSVNVSACLNHGPRRRYILGRQTSARG